MSNHVNASNHASRSNQLDPGRHRSQQPRTARHLHGSLEGFGDISVDSYASSDSDGSNDSEGSDASDGSNCI